jgi:hypothetical protein
MKGKFSFVVIMDGLGSVGLASAYRNATSPSAASTLLGNLHNLELKIQSESVHNRTDFGPLDD